MAEEQYEVICWGACEGEGDCHIYWGYNERTGQFRRSIKEGDIVPPDFPESSIRHEVAAGHIRKVDKKAQAREEKEKAKEAK